MKCRALILAAVGAITLSGCATTIPDENRYTPLVNGPERLGVTPAPTRSYLRSTTEQEIGRSRFVRANVPNGSVAEVMALTIPDISYEIVDGGVDLGKRISLVANNITLQAFLDLMSVRTGYDFTLHSVGRASTVRIASIAHRSWNLSGLSHNRKSVTTVGGEDNEEGGGGGQGISAQGGTSSGGGSQARRATEITITSEEDEWEATIAQLRAMLQTDQEGSTAMVTSVRSVGLIHAYGPPTLVRAADRWVRDLVESTGTQVHLSMSIHEVTLSDNRAAGINWNLLTDGVFADGEGIVTAGIEGSLQTALGVSGAGSLSIATTGLLRDDSLGVFLNFLNQFGKTTLLTQPNITVSNGRSATLSSGEEFSFVESVIVNTTSQGTSTITPVLSRILVGVEFTVTPRLRGDGKILLDIVPVVSTLQSFNEFSVGDSSFQTPRIALNELATQVVIVPGQTVHVGGLITDRLAETINRLPLSQRSFFDKLFRAESNALERRELVLTITARTA